MQIPDAILTAPPALNCNRDAPCLDFDGTLVEIAQRPDAIIVPPDLPTRLSRLSRACGGAFAVVSGRDLATLERFLPGYDGLLVGSHGAEARGLDLDETEISDPAPVQAALAAFAAQSGVLYERKSHGGALHFRACPEAEAEVARFVNDLAATHSGFAVQPAKMAFELRPRGASKDRALAALATLPAFAGRQPIFFGDDTTDEPALGWAEAHGGYGVKVGPGESVARYRLPDPAAVLDWLAAAEV